MMLKFIALDRLKSTNLNLQSFKSTPPEYVKIKIVYTDTNTTTHTLNNRHYVFVQGL